MTVFESIKNKSIDELVDWIDNFFAFDESPYWQWWNENYCDKCDGVDYFDEENHRYFMGYCELYNNCRFFKDMKEAPDRKQIIKMWLESKINN